MKCLTPDCSSETIYSRGLCNRCYTRQKKRVRRGTTTWEELINQGLAKRARIKGATSAKRRAGQLNKQTIEDDYSLMERKYAKIYLKQGYAVEGKPLTDEERKMYEKILGIGEIVQ